MKRLGRAYRFSIAGKLWRWKYRPMRNNYGICDYTSRTITIDTPQAGQTRLDTEIHEALHALQCFANEEHVLECAGTLAEILWKIGYRLTEEVDGRGYLGD